MAATAVGGGATQAAGRAAGFWGAEVLPNNSGAPVNQTVDVVAADPGQGSGGSDLVSTDSVTTPVAPDTETHTYDEDGNLLTDGLYTYEWDAENRLTAMQTNATQIWSGTNRRRYKHYYDYLNRRVRSDTLASVGSSWFQIRYSTFYYEGWNMIREKIYDADLGTTYYRTLAWGLDIVGSLSSSGGVQGLIAMRDSYEAKTYLPGYDANGNVAVMLDAADGSIEAAYEYSPFGEYLRKEGDYADENPIRFSTKYTDDATNLVYYGRRYYDPKDGRFVGRDPIEERGGLNLYAFVANNTVNSWDYLGMSGTTADEGDFDDFLSGSGNATNWNQNDWKYFMGYAYGIGISSRQRVGEGPGDMVHDFFEDRSRLLSFNDFVVPSGFFVNRGPRNRDGEIRGPNPPNFDPKLILLNLSLNGNTSRIGRLNNFTKRQCAQLKAVLSIESDAQSEINLMHRSSEELFGVRSVGGTGPSQGDLSATQVAARLASITFDDSQNSLLIPNLGSLEILNDFNSSQGVFVSIPEQIEVNGQTVTTNGRLDLDWFTDITAIAPGRGLAADSTYVFGKILWTVSRWFNNESIGNPWPGDDPGEVSAVSLVRVGARYADIFTPEFMEQECPSN